jgi:predicted membrane protein
MRVGEKITFNRWNILDPSEPTAETRTIVEVHHICLMLLTACTEPIFAVGTTPANTEFHLSPPLTLPFFLSGDHP